MSEGAKRFAANWAHKWFGFWAEEEQVTRSPFSIENHVDPAWNPEDREKLIDYLMASPVALAAQQPMVKCGLCDELVSNSCYRSDGEWLWTDSLGHLVEHHNFVLPDRLVEHIRSRSHRPPVSISVPVSNLPWPPPLSPGR